ncbi:MAG: hypothetical protein U9N34_04285 [Candidatus Cloacimonadota bacterium]|nr:hypothetical protein [Candidatus Cloacimonadota bacterium]
MKKKIVFMYLHGIHQLYHSAVVAMELSILQDEYKIELLSCHPNQTAILNQIASLYPQNRCHIVQLPLPFRFKYLNIKKKIYPPPYLTMRFAKKYLIGASAIVATSHATARSSKKINITKPKFIYQYHGCGDRKYGFDPKFKDFDFMLLPGNYHLKRLLEENVIKKEQTKIIGWPKMDYPILTKEVKKKLFKNNRPIVLYNPHWKPSLSSYHIWAEKILTFFSKSSKYNLIFAPHIQIKHWQVKYKYNIDYDRFKSDNIHIDFGSNQSVNGTYQKIGDIYMGDVSSMIYEFIAYKERPCVLLNAHKVSWENDANYRFWQYGPVVDHIEELESKITEAINTQSFLELQKKRIKEYMNLTHEKSSLRAAKAILNYLKPSDKK